MGEDLDENSLRLTRRRRTLSTADRVRSFALVCTRVEWPLVDSGTADIAERAPRRRLTIFVCSLDVSCFRGSSCDATITDVHGRNQTVTADFLRSRAPRR